MGVRVMGVHESQWEWQCRATLDSSVCVKLSKVAAAATTQASSAQGHEGIAQRVAGCTQSCHRSSRCAGLGGGERAKETGGVF